MIGSDAFHKSLNRCADQDGFFDHFYGVFLSSSPEIPPFFEGIDMERQKRHLRMSFYVIAIHLPRLETIETSTYFHAMRKRHQELGIQARHYNLWVEALVETVAAFDPQFDDEVEQIWYYVLGEVIERMLPAKTHP